MPIEYASLQTELTTDPRGYGYRALISTTEGGTKTGPSQDAEVSGLINTVRNGTNPPANPTAAGGAANGAILIRRSNVNTVEILEAIDNRDFEPAPTALDVAWFTAAMGKESLRLSQEDGSNTRVLSNIRRMLQNADVQGSDARVQLIANRFGSRAEELFGQGTSLHHADIARALGRF